MPQASMSSANVGMMSTGRSSNRQSIGMNYSSGAGAFGIITCATGIRGGVTTKQTAAMMSTSEPNRAGVRRAKRILILMEIRMVYLIADVIGTMKMEFGSVPFVIVK